MIPLRNAANRFVALERLSLLSATKGRFKESNSTPAVLGRDGSVANQFH